MKTNPTTAKKVKDFKNQINNWMKAYNESREEFPEEAERFLKYAQQAEQKLKKFLEIKQELNK